ncbi:MAG: DUF4861 family protein, partial [Candidatus Sumerlaeota bacterium]|nr:DUF4861 family protein [Candidatus Sumerlaeota bacterium]
RGSEEGAISCGVDVWAKRTRSLIINKWYSRGNYSYDNGEGLDFYTVGSGLGCGASGVWAAGKLWHAKNFAKQKLIANGPVRAVFELAYPSYNAGATTVTETRRISLDAGSNLSRFEVTFNTVPPTTSALTCVAGIARHRGMESATNPSKAWLATWETQYGASGAFLGCGIVMNPNLLTQFTEDYAHHYMVAKAETGKPFVYYAGAGWTRSGDFEDYEPWKAYLNQFARRLLEPVKVKIALE